MNLTKYPLLLAGALGGIFAAYGVAHAKPDDRRPRAESPYSNQSMRREREAKRIIREIDRSERPRHFVWSSDRRKGK